MLLFNQPFKKYECFEVQIDINEVPKIMFCYYSTVHLNPICLKVINVWSNIKMWIDKTSIELLLSRHIFNNDDRPRKLNVLIYLFFFYMNLTTELEAGYTRLKNHPVYNGICEYLYCTWNIIIYGMYVGTEPTKSLKVVQPFPTVAIL